MAVGSFPVGGGPVGGPSAASAGPSAPALGPGADDFLEAPSASSAGPGLDAVAEFIQPASLGPGVDDELLGIPAFSSGAVNDNFVVAATTGHGSSFDHIIEATIPEVNGPISDVFVAVAALTKHGPIFGHDVEALSGSLVGPVHDEFGTPSGASAHGPSFHHIVEEIVVIPTPSAPVTPSKRLIETLSPFVYRLEVEPGFGRRITGKSNR